MISTFRFAQYPHHNFSSHSVLSMMVSCLFASGLLFLSISCKSPAEVEETALFGEWDIYKAERNGKETPYLRGGYFVIKSEGKVTFNITGVNEEGPYTLEQNTMSVNAGSKEFMIESQTTDSMTLRYIMNPQSEFLFYLNRKRDESN